MIHSDLPLRRAAGPLLDRLAFAALLGGAAVAYAVNAAEGRDNHFVVRDDDDRRLSLAPNARPAATPDYSPIGLDGDMPRLLPPVPPHPARD